MDLRKAKWRLLKKDDWYRVEFFGIVLGIINLEFYLIMYLRYHGLHNFSQADISDIKLVNLSYNFPWWSSSIFIFLWFGCLWLVNWYLSLLISKSQKAKRYCPNQSKKDLLQTEILDGEILFCKVLIRAFNIAGPILGAVFAVIYGGALYGLVFNLFFGAYILVFLFLFAALINFIPPLYRFFSS